MRKQLLFFKLLFLITTISFSQEGIIDAGFTTGSGFNGTVKKMAEQTDGKIIVGGQFTSYNGTSKNRLLRLNADGTVDNSFLGFVNDGEVNAIAIQADGKILIGGTFGGVNSNGRNRIARLNADGTLDNSFSYTGGINGIVYDIKIQSDAKIIAVGNFSGYNGYGGAIDVVRINTNGTPDTSVNFNINGIVYSVSIQSDDKSILVGQFNAVNGAGRNNIARLNTNGSVDNTFIYSGGSNGILYDSKIQTDGKILIGGGFNVYNGYGSQGLLRINSDGSPDTSFNTFVNGTLNSLSIQADGKYIITGSFNHITGIGRNNIARLNDNGSLDNSFSYAGGLNTIGFDSKIQADGKILIGGQFTSYSGTGANRIVRINGANPVTTSTATHLNFDGSNDRVDLGNSLSSEIDALNTITVEAYVRPTTLTGNGVVFGNYAYPTDNGQAQLLIRRDGANYNFFINDGSLKVVTATNAAQLNTWTHVAGVWNGTDIKIYVDGVLANTNTGVTGANFITLANSFVVGFSLAGSPDEAFRGDIDELRVWSTVRSESEINSAKNCELQGDEVGLIRYYQFNQGDDSANNSTVTTLTDSSSSANNGTLINFALTGTTSNWLAGSPIVTGSIIPSEPSVTTPITYNQGDTASPLTATLGANGTGLLWYTSATGGTGVTTAPTPSTTTVGNTSYWVSSTNANGCESERVEIIVTVNAVLPATHLNFDGVDDRANANNSSLPFGNSTRTLEAWVKTNTTVTGTIVNYGNQSNNQRFGLLVLGSGELYIVGEFNDYNAGGTLNDNNWHHVAVSFNGSTLTAYIDGVIVGSTNTAYSTTGNLLGLGASYRTTSWGEHLNGNIDEVRIWNTAKSQSEIQDKMNCELMGNETGLVSYYKFNQGNGAANNATITTAVDASPSANNATLNNMALNGATSNWLAGSTITTGNTCATLSVTNFNIDNDFKIYPNPTKNSVTILSAVNEKGLISVYDINGRLLKNENLNSKSIIDLSSFQTGMYLFKIQTELGVTTKQIVKQ
jgi:uncharacterized delta-60 repeat protein